MINLFKKLFIVLVVLSLPFILIGCGGEQPPVVTYFFTPKTTEMTLIRGEQGTIEYETNLEDEVYFESYDEKIATVDENGVVTAVKTGTTSIYASCGGYDYKVVPIYGTVTVTEKDYRTEPLYGTVCYQSTKTRKIIDKGHTYYKWSSYNDRSLLDHGWTYTGKRKVK
jgi:hypothetical protein